MSGNLLPAPTKSSNTSPIVGNLDMSKLLDCPTTDIGNAQRLVLLYGNSIRYCHPWRKWLIWDGKRWRIDDCGKIELWAKKTILTFHKAALGVSDADKQRRLLKHALSSQYDGRLRAMIHQATTEPGVPVRVSELDSAPDLLNCLNGTVDLRSGALL